MPKILILIFLFFIPVLLFCDEIELFSDILITRTPLVTSSSVPNLLSILSQKDIDRYFIKYYVVYNTKDENIYINTDYSYIRPIIILKNNLHKFREVLIKYLDWKNIANQNNIEISKEIPDSYMEMGPQLKVGTSITGTILYKFPVINFRIETFKNTLNINTGNKYLNYGLNYFLRMEAGEENITWVENFQGVLFYNVNDLLHSLSNDYINSKINEYNERQNKLKVLFR